MHVQTCDCGVLLCVCCAAGAGFPGGFPFGGFSSDIFEELFQRDPFFSAFRGAAGGAFVMQVRAHREAGWLNGVSASLHSPAHLPSRLPVHRV